MALNIDTFTNNDWRPGNNFGGNTLFKALGHPLAARGARTLLADMSERGPVAIYDPLGQAQHFDSFYNLAACEISGVHVQRLEDLETAILGRSPTPVTELSTSTARTLFVTAFDAARIIDHIRPLIPTTAEVRSFDDFRLPDDMLTDRRTYLAPLNFATNFGYLRDGDGAHTRVVSANYWSGYGAQHPALWLCLFDAGGAILAQWREDLGSPGQSIVIDSRQVRERFNLGEFAGSLFIHAVGIAGHDVVKYALDTFNDSGESLSATHDANAWPADLYAGLPAPDAGEQVVLWIQNSHPVAIPPGSVGLNLMGSQDIRWLDEEVPAFGSRALDVSDLLPDATWPAQIEVQAGCYFVRPRYEITTRDGHRRIAHANVERTNLTPDPNIPKLGAHMGKGYMLPLPVLPLKSFSSVALPTPMATDQHELPLRVHLVDASGEDIDQRYLGRIARHKSVAIDIDAWLAEAAATMPSGYGHMELLYDFRDGGEADGWLHAIGRYQRRASGHAAETSFGAHIYNTPMVYRDEPQSYAGPPPGLSTRLFLRLGSGALDTMCHLIYPASTPWRPTSSTQLILYDSRGQEVASPIVEVPCGGSLLWRYHELYSEDTRRLAGDEAYVQIRDTTCRLFGFQGLIGASGAFSLDHTFGY